MGAEGADYIGGVLVLGVYGKVHGAHVVGGDFACQAVEGGGDLRPALEAFFADEGDGFVGGKVVEVVGEWGEVEGRYRTVGGVAGDDVDLVGGEGAVEET